jgi:glycosyltransferase involved in cell wall biosynthesis
MSAALPRITVVTPSYNQAAFLERTIISVLNQGYPNIEYIIIDGGSTDGSVDIIKRYSSQLTYWESTPDRGQSHAINKGLQRATGDWVCWQNSDDIFYPSTFLWASQAVKKNPQLDFIIGDINLIDEADNILRPMCYVKPTYESLLAEGMVLTNQAAFWRRAIHNEIGWLDESLHYGFDYEWFLRLLKYTNKSYHIPKLIGALRFHNETKTSLNQIKFKEEYAQILDGRSISNLKKYFYRVRRLLLTLSDGRLAYVFNGLKSRCISKLTK